MKVYVMVEGGVEGGYERRFIPVRELVNKLLIIRVNGGQ